MSDRLNAAQAALNAGRRDEAIEHLSAAIAEDPALAPGDARAAWADGAATMRLQDRRAALTAMLASLGLADPTEEGQNA